MKRRLLGLVGTGLAAILSPVAPAKAGPPYETDDPEPTEVGHSEIYAFTGFEGGHGNLDGTTGIDLNYGPVKDLQLTATLPLDYSLTPGNDWRAQSGDVEVGAKYRFLDLTSTGVSVAIFPRVFLPTSKTSSRARLLLPVWVQKQAGKTTIFGGGGYELNPGAGNRDFWLAGAAITHAFSQRVTLGAEATHQSPDALNATSRNSLAAGAVVKLREPYSVLVSLGPSWSGGQASYHAYAALGLNF